MAPDNAFFIEGKERPRNLIILCDHASNRVPADINGGDLGLCAADMGRHIAYDIGAKGLSLALGRALDAPVVGSNFSRLVIDPNRGADGPTVLMRLYDGTLIPANRHADHAEKQRRLAHHYRPYDAAIAELVAAKPAPALISIHSFTRQLRGRAKRPWHVGVLFADDDRLSAPLINSLQQSDWNIGINQPYKGSLAGDTMERHAIANGLHHTLIEIRNDLIETEADQTTWAHNLVPHIETAMSEVGHG